MAIFFQENLPIGLDISDYKLRLVQLKKRGRKNKIISFAEVEVPKGVISDGLPQQPRQLVELLKQLKKQVKGVRLLTNKVIVGLPEKQSFIKLISLSSARNKEIIKEISKHVPFDIKDIYYDFQVKPDFFANTKALHFAAGKKILVKNYINILETVGFEPMVFEIETQAITRSLFLPNDEYAYLIADIGLARTTIFVVYQGLVIFSISFPSIVKEKEAYLSELIPQIKKVLTFYNQNLYKEIQPTALITCGTGAHVKNLNQETEKNFNIKSVPGNPWQNISNSTSFLSKKIKYPLSYTTAIGLALRSGLNKDYI